MNIWDYFWTEESDLPPGSGFPQMGPAHLLFLAVTLLLICLFLLWFRKMTPERKIVAVRVVALLLPLLEIWKLLLLKKSGHLGIGYLPLHLCSMTIYLYPVVAFLKGPKQKGNLSDEGGETDCEIRGEGDEKVGGLRGEDERTVRGIRGEDETARGLRAGLTEVAVITLLPAGFAALIFPDWTMYPIWNFYSLHSFAWHALQVVMPIMCLMLGWCKPRITHIWMNTLFLLGVGVVIYILDKHISCNYWFLLWPIKGTPLEWINNIVGARWYVPALLVFATIINLIMYGIMRIIRILTDPSQMVQNKKNR